jgi:hypothetical protein
MIVDKKKDFIVRELWTMAWAASVQHAKVYKPGTKYDSKGVKDFRREVASYVGKELLPMYKMGCGEERHYVNINCLVAYASKVGSTVLPRHGYKYGVAQKLLNLCLKYHWCLGRISEPPHCPIDRIIIGKTSFRGKLKWTDIRSREKYATVIDEIAKLAENEDLSIAGWELRNYRRR